MYFRTIQLTLILVGLLSVTACSTLKPGTNWPSNLPDRQIFVDAYLQKRNIDSADQSAIDYHLTWVKRFYQGTLIYPNGWNQATASFLATVNDDAKKARVRVRMQRLGIDIANEWAQENGVRKIDSANVAVWGSALHEAANRDDHLGYISRVETDVAKLIAGKIEPTDIDYERYYPDDDYDSF